MTRKQRAQQHLAHLQQEWDLLNEKLSRLERAKILETRADEIFRLEHTIEDVKKQIQHVEQGLKDVELVGTAPENELESQVKKAIREFENNKQSIFVVYGNVSCFDEGKEKFYEYFNQKKNLLHLCVDAKLAKCETLVHTIIELVLRIGDQFTDKIADSDEKNQLIRNLYLIGKFSRQTRGQDSKKALAHFQSNADHIFYPGFIPIIRKNQPIVVSLEQFEEILIWSTEVRSFLLEALLDRVTAGHLRFVIFAKHSPRPRLYSGSNQESTPENIGFYKLQETAAIGEDAYKISSLPASQITPNDFDVFLCHNSIDKPAVKEIGRQLKKEGILPWLDEWELRPGFIWQHELEKHLEHIKSAAVFVGQNGFGPWQDMELSAFLRQFVKRGCPVIPVILPDCEDVPTLPIFLEGMLWVDFRKNDPDPLKQLIWGITGKEPAND